MSTWRTVPQRDWQPFFDRVSKGLLGTKAEVEAASLELGDQIVAEWVPMLGITYDTRDDLLDIVFDRGNHVINHPREIAVEEAGDGLTGVAVIDADGARQVVRLKAPMMLR